jgi:phage recombination protein Bet
MEKNMSKSISKQNNAMVNFASKFNIDVHVMEKTLRDTVFKQSGDEQITNEQMVALMIVASEYGLNPFTKEIYAFPDKQGGIIPVVGVDGWSRLINSRPSFNGMDFNQSDKMVKIDENSKNCPEWIEVIIHHKDRQHPTVVREYLDEVYKKAAYSQRYKKAFPGPWQTHTKRMLRHKAMIQGGRVAFGYSGIYDDDEAQNILENHEIKVINPEPEEKQTNSRVDMVKSKIEKKAECEPIMTVDDKEALLKKINACDSLIGLNDLQGEGAAFSGTEHHQELVNAFVAKRDKLKEENSTKKGDRDEYMA